MPAKPKRKSSRKIPIKLIVYTAPWCGPCRAHKAVVRRVMKRDPAIELEVIDVEEPQNRARARGINVVPTTVVMGGGVVLAVAEGEHGVRELQHLIRACRAKAHISLRAVRQARTEDLQRQLAALAEEWDTDMAQAAQAASARPAFGLEVLEVLAKCATARVSRTGRGGPTVAVLAAYASAHAGRPLPRRFAAYNRAIVQAAAAARAAGYRWHADVALGLASCKLDMRLTPPAA